MAYDKYLNDPYLRTISTHSGDLLYKMMFDVPKYLYKSYLFTCKDGTIIVGKHTEVCNNEYNGVCLYVKDAVKQNVDGSLELLDEVCIIVDDIESVSDPFDKDKYRKMYDAQHSDEAIYDFITDNLI